ncbi:TRAP transporter substrate-binding protein DctP [Desulfatiglans anilini]|uniref:TRAP transporter substrate-binding protein DctP n=1 Tax=Desulfatiglans anilini TaxID=90728 RepID=UPI001376F836|nr:TRAP transporter substrate-binding protein DctP [Desulfatiglans anilini]
MKKAFLLIACITLFLGLTAIESKSEMIVLKAVTGFPKNHLNNDPVPILVDKINKRAEGKLRIEWVGGPEVIQSFDQIHALKAGTIDMILYYPFGYLKPIMPEAWAKGLTELAEWEERKTGAYDLWCEIFEKRANAKYLGRLQSFLPFKLFVNKKIEKVEDIKGLKIRVQPLYIPFIKALGATPVSIPPTEIYTGMERGVVDGFMWPNVGVISWGLQEVTKYAIEPGVFQMEPATMINLDKWKKIPPDVQDLIMDVMQDMEYIGTMRNTMIEQTEEKVRKAAGMETLTLPPEEAQKFRAIAYDKTWEYVIEAAPEYGPKLRELTSRKAIPKDVFPWD